MYLTSLNPKTGLLEIEEGNDGILAIKEFRDVIQNKKLGLHCLTAIALTADYQSPILYYNDKDRPRKAQEEVTGDRDAYEWNTEIIQKALKKYDDLQYDPTLEEKRIYYNQKVMKLKAIQGFDNKQGDEVKIGGVSMSQLKKDLRAINSDIEAFDKRVAGLNIFSESPVVNGYTLSRLEQKLEKRNSFYHDVK